jgi:hypothetical protein
LSSWKYHVLLPKSSWRSGEKHLKSGDQNVWAILPMSHLLILRRVPWAMLPPFIDTVLILDPFNYNLF